MNPDMDVCKTPWKTANTMYQNISYVGAQF